jgi:hypothetical protein
MPASEESPNHDRPTMKDVVEIVTSTRRELSDSLFSLGAKFDAFVTSNEHRLTVVEMHQASQGSELSAVGLRLNQHGEEIGQLKDRANQDEAATRAIANARGNISKRWASRGTAIATISSLIFAASIIIAFFH